jgi:hypothetical protein
MSHDVNTSNAGPTSATVSPAKLRILLACGVIAGQLLVGVAALQALTRDGFGPQPSLPQPAELGDLGWIQVTNFVVPGLLPTAFAVGMWLVLHPRRAGTWGAILRGVFGAGLVAGGVSSLTQAWLPLRGPRGRSTICASLDVAYQRH